MSQVSPDAAEGSITTMFYKDTSGPRVGEDPGMKLHKEIMAKYYPEGSGRRTEHLRHVHGLDGRADSQEARKDLSRENLQQAYRQHELCQ